jgi:glycosyltransferase involved in cell wall biosynthesis
MKNALVSKSNLFVMPSIIYKKSVEGFGIAFVEAAQYGIPSIGGIDGGASDAISQDKIQYYIHPKVYKNGKVKLFARNGKYNDINQFLIDEETDEIFYLMRDHI